MMGDHVTREEVEWTERMLQRMFARVSCLEARVNEMERELAAARQERVEVERPRLVEALGRTA